MVERQRLVCGCDNPSYLQCRIRAVPVFKSCCYPPPPLPHCSTSCWTHGAELPDVAKRIQASYPKISAVYEIRFNDDAAIAYKITRVGDSK